MADMPKKSLASPDPPEDGSSSISDAIYKLVSSIPDSSEHLSSEPKRKAQSLATSACMRAAGISTTLSLPPGPVGMLTIIPDLVAIWKIQSQLVSDIAAGFGKSGALTRESMIYCLFRHGSAALVRDLVVRVGERVVIRRASLRIFQQLLSKIGIRVTQRVVGRTLSRWIPVLGALGVGAYAYYDTGEVAKNAIELFSKDIDVEPEKKKG